VTESSKVVVLAITPVTKVCAMPFYIKIKAKIKPIILNFINLQIISTAV